MPILPLVAAVTFLLATRVWELRRSARNERLMRERGGAPAPGGGPFALFVLLHAAFPVALVAEVVAGGARSGPLWPLWLAVWTAGEALRFAAIRTLGDRWSTRVYVVPGEARVRRGIYRYLPHPNYLGVILELAALPLLFGAWRTALGVGIANALLLAARVRAEEGALAESERAAFDLGLRPE